MSQLPDPPKGGSSFRSYAFGDPHQSRHRVDRASTGRAPDTAEWSSARVAVVLVVPYLVLLHVPPTEGRRGRILLDQDSEADTLFSTSVRHSKSLGLGRGSHGSTVARTARRSGSASGGAGVGRHLEEREWVDIWRSGRNETAYAECIALFYLLSRESCRRLRREPLSKLFSTLYYHLARCWSARCRTTHLSPRSLRGSVETRGRSTPLEQRPCESDPRIRPGRRGVWE